MDEGLGWSSVEIGFVPTRRKHVSRAQNTRQWRCEGWRSCGGIPRLRARCSLDGQNSSTATPKEQRERVCAQWATHGGIAAHTSQKIGRHTVLVRGAGGAFRRCCRPAPPHSRQRAHGAPRPASASTVAQAGMDATRSRSARPETWERRGGERRPLGAACGQNRCWQQERREGRGVL